MKRHIELDQRKFGGYGRMRQATSQRKRSRPVRFDQQAKALSVALDRSRASYYRAKRKGLDTSALEAKIARQAGTLAALGATLD